MSLLRIDIVALRLSILAVCLTTGPIARAEQSSDRTSRVQSSEHLRLDKGVLTVSPFRLTIQRSDYRVSVDDTNAADKKIKSRSEFSPVIERHARAKGLDPALVHAVIRAESAYRPDALSPKGAIGLMQG